MCSHGLIWCDDDDDDGRVMVMMLNNVKAGGEEMEECIRELMKMCTEYALSV